MTTTTQLSHLTGAYVLDRTRTKIAFVTHQLRRLEVRGEFETYVGSGHLDGDDPSRSRAELTIQTASIQTRNAQRDGHLRRFFLDSAHHPTIRFTSTRVRRVDEAHVEVSGDLTIRGVTRPVTVALTYTPDEAGIRLQGNLAISRKDCGVRWNAVVEGGGFFVSDKVTMEFDVAAVRAS